MARLSVGAIALATTIALTGCQSPPSNRESRGVPQSSVVSPQSSVATQSSDAGGTSGGLRRAASAHDLSADEAMGGHTLDRHIGKTDEELVQRLHREPDISSASTYTDRAMAERVIGAALASGGSAFEKWRARRGRRPNFVLHYDAHEVIGRSVRRGRTRSQPCERALVVLRWDDRRQQFYVLTSYPEENR
jgi:CDI toxin RNase A-like protein